MEAAIECTHCKVVMTSWSAPGSQIRYYQCPFCARTHSSLYREVFRRRAGARVLDPTSRPQPSRAAGIPMASQEDIRWANVKQTAARWFARLEAEQRRNGPAAPRPAHAPARAPARALRAAATATAVKAAAPAFEDVPELDPDDVVELTPSPRFVRGR
jgi:hypothetical protein